MKLKSKEQGFTLIELLLVVVIIGILLAVIVPRAWRANIDAKYGLVRQNATELSSIGVQWAENQLNGQDSVDSTAQLVDYLAYITSEKNWHGGTVESNIWIAEPDNTRNAWINTTLDDMDAPDAERQVGGDVVGPSGPAIEMMPKDRRARNPFNGMDVFDVSNFPQSTAIPGAIGSGFYEDGELGDDWYYFGLRFQGTDNDDGIDENEDYHADMAGNSLNALRAGVFMARAQRN